MNKNIKTQLDEIPNAVMVEFYDANRAKKWPICAYKREECAGLRADSHGTFVIKQENGWPDIWLWEELNYRIIIKNNVGLIISEIKPIESVSTEPVYAPAPPEIVPAGLSDLIRENEAYGEAQARLWALYVSLQNKLMLGIASEIDARLHTRLHGHLAWISKGAVEVTRD